MSTTDWLYLLGFFSGINTGLLLITLWILATRRHRF